MLLVMHQGAAHRSRFDRSCHAMEACYSRLHGRFDGCLRQSELLGPPLSFRRPEIELTIGHKTIATAAEAFHTLEELALRPGRQTVFRGHRKEGWRLTSTLHRHGGLLQTHSLDGALSHFIVNLKSVGTPIPFAVDDRRARMEYGRHYGIPSPLIDFSYSPYVAMFFAFDGVRPEASAGEQAVIYALDVTNLGMIWARHVSPSGDPAGTHFNRAYARFMTEFRKFDPAADGTGPATTHFFGDGYPQNELKLFAFPASWNIRMQRQMGAFLYDTNRYGRGLKDLEEFIEKEAEIPGPDGSEPCLIKIRTPHALAREVFERLELAGIIGTRLLDDHEGAAADVKNAVVYNRRTGYAWDLILPTTTFQG